MTKPRVLAVGSCRIVRPLRILAEQGAIHLVNAREPGWFTHSVNEGLQYVRILTGEVDVPSSLRPFLDAPPVSEAPTLRGLFDLSNLDLVLVEVSLLRDYTASGFYLHHPKLWNEAYRLGLDPKAATNGAGVLWPVGHPLQSLKVSAVSAPHILQGLKQIARACAAPVATVDHLYALTDEGKPVSGRDKITNTLAGLELREGIPFLSTRPLIEGHGQLKALKDSNHYNQAFEPVAAEYFRAFLERVLARRLAA